MRNRLLNIIFLLLLVSELAGQSGTNQWINYSQKYFKFPVVAEGLYKISYQTLFNAGIDVNTINPQNFQVFARGQEQYIFVQGEDDDIFDPTDYILVYGKKNDGYFDAQMYKDPSYNPNPYYSLVNDTSYYFVTYNHSTSNKRIIEDTDINFTGYTASPYFNYEQVQSQTNQYSGGSTTAIDTYLPSYSPGEGWVSSTMYYGQSKTFTFSTPSYYAAGGNGTVEATLVGLTNDPSNWGDHKLQVSFNNSLKTDTIYEGHAFLKFKYSLAPAEWQSSSTFKIESDGTYADTKADRSAVGYVKMKYPRSFDLGNATSMKMEILNGSAGKAYLSISNFDNQGSPAYVFDLTNHYKLPVVKSGAVYKALVPNSAANAKNCLLTSEANYINVAALEPVIYSSNLFTNYKSLSQSNGGYDYFILTVKEFKTEAEAYKAYRNSTGYKAVVIDMEELYMQYSDGIRKHPMAIRNFATDIIKNWNTNPQYFFLIGKSIQPGTPDSKNASYSENNSSRREPTNYKMNKIPTFGYPGSDVFLTAQITDSSLYDPDIPLGRLSATTGEEILDYLNKVQAFEANPHAYWMKRVLHFGGGTDKSQGDQFASYLNYYKNIIEDTCFGGTVNTYLKNTTDPLQVNVSDSIRTNINDGCSIMTFFGHAYGEGFDQNIDAPESYTNLGKYPLIIANSCLIGNIHLPTSTSGSETWVMAENRGAIGFLASVSLGIPTPLHQYTSSVYENLGKKNYGKGIGKIMQGAIRKVQKPENTLLSDDPYIEDVCMMMTLHCDPAIVINAHTKPDYTIYGPNGVNQPMVSVNPTEVTSELTSFTVNLTIANIGKAIGDSLVVRIIRKFPTNAPDTIYFKKIGGVKYKTSLQFTMPVDLINGIGTNHFSILIDSEYAIDELDETNNQYDFDITIRSGDIVPIYPYQYAIVPKKSVVLKASTINPLAPERKYIFQIDTNSNFSSSSPLFYEASITKAGGVVTWDPADDPGLANIFNSLKTNTTLAAPTVFFWRVSLDSSYTHKFNWKYSSFQYVQGKSGWGQAHFQQIDDDEFKFIEHHDDTRSFSFLQHIRELAATSSSWLSAGNTYSIDGSLQGYWSLIGGNLLMVAVIDQYSLEPWEVNKKPYYNQINYKNSYIQPTWSDKIYWYYSGRSDDSTVTGITNLINDAKAGDYIVMYNFRYPFFKENFNNHGANGAAFKAVLQSLGASTDSLNNYIGAPGSCPYPYILIAQKGNPSFAKEAFTTDCGSAALSASMTNNWINGSIKSPMIGPALKWSSLHWESTSNEGNNKKDTLILRVIGIDANNNETVIKSFVSSKNDVLSLDTLVDASLYPYIRLESYFSDDSLHTPNQLKRTQVVYDEVPEIAVSPNIAFYIPGDSLQEGNDYKMTLALTNVSSTNMDSVQVTYWFSDATLTNSTKQYKLLPPIKAGNFYVDTVLLSTMNLNGNNHMWYEANPYTGPRAWQTEQYHFNNILETRFEVYPDRINPLLDVAFDGVHIINGDIVSPTALITIQLKDENQFLALDNPALIQVFIKDPNGNVTVLDSTDYVFYPATLPENKSRIELKGDFKIEGNYELMVRAVDRSANESGKGDGNYDYRIEFQVVLKSAITNFLNWPNPFTTSTQFVFVLTGSEIPDELNIKIMTVTGKVVKEISLDEIGPIHIGRNVTEYKWDGTDEFGDILANGVYIYTVDAKINGESIDKWNVKLESGEEDNTSLNSKYFKKGFGKIYIMR
ncbi:MAG: C25 family cysteine peptidase [Flavobacteriales bacterium]